MAKRRTKAKGAKSAKRTKAGGAKARKGAKPGKTGKTAKAKPTKTAKNKPRAVAKPKAAKQKPAKVSEQEQEQDAGAAIAGWSGRVMIVRILGDAEAYFFDFAALSNPRRSELVAHHLAAVDARMKASGKTEWLAQFVPFALLGESMPPAARDRFDLSAPHEGVLMLHAPSGALLYGSNDEAKLAILAPDLGSIAPRPSFVGEAWEPDAHSYAYEIDRGRSAGFTLGEIETLMRVSGAALTLV